MVSTALWISLSGGTAGAMPEGSQVTSGNAVIEMPDASSMNINQSSSKAIINWNSFSIGNGEQVRFNQPSSSSLTVNRVTGTESSSINGKMSANGNVMIINGNGILFGGSAVVDVNGLVATTINTTDQHILNNDFTFNGPGDPSAKVINHGKITASEGGLVALVAPGVENHGTIEAKLGKVTMGSADAFTIDLYGDGLVKFPATQDVLQGNVSNTGTIKADGGRVALTAQTAKRVVDDVINMDGLIEAHSVGMVNGEIILGGGGEGVVKVAGTIDASADDAGEKGGKVKVLGEKVGLFDGAKIDVSGDAGAGEILTGGNFQGKGPEQNAKATYVAETASLDASSENGDAGRVIVWADEVTNYYGTIDASAGNGGGDGGFVEVSGKDFLDFQGTVDRSAVSGEAGTLLLDPRNVTISTGANTNMPGASPFDASGDNAILNTTTLVNALATGNVIVSTGSTGAQAGDITVSNDIIVGAGATGSLTLNAANNVNVNASIDFLAGTGSITMNADFDQSGAGIFQAAPASAKVVRTNGADITITGDDITTGNTNINYYSNGGNIYIRPAVASEALTFQVSGGPAGVFKLGDTEIDRFNSGSGMIIFGGAGFNGDITNVSTGDATSAGTFMMLTTGKFSVNTGTTLSINGNDLIISANKVDIQGSLTSSSQDVTIRSTTAGNAINLGSATDVAANTLELSDAEIDRLSFGLLTIGNAAAGAITVSSDISAATPTTVSLITGSSITGTAGGIVETDLALTAGGTINFTDTTTDVDNLAISAAGQSVDFLDVDDIDIDTVAGVTGATAGTLHLRGTSITDTQRILATNLAVTATGAVTLDHASNDVDNLAINAAGQTIDFVDADDIDIDTVAGVTGITAGTVHLHGTSITDTQRTAVTNLAITSTGAITLDHASNDVDNLAINAAGQTIDFVDADDIDIDTVAGVTGITAGTVHLHGTSITDTQRTLATNLALTATGAVTLDVATNDVDNLAINAAGQTVEFRDTDDIDIDTVAGVTGATAGTLYLRGTSITDTQRIQATNLALTTTGAITLDHASNDVDNLAISAAGQTVDFVDADDIDIDTVAGITGITAGTVHLHGTSITDTQRTQATNLALTATGAITLDHASNDVDNLAINAAGQTVDFVDVDDIDVDTVAGVTGITAGTVHLHGTSITDTQRTQATNLAISATGAVTLDHASNDVDNLAISAAGQTVDFVDVDDIDIDTVAGITGITAGTVHLHGTSITDAQRILATNLAVTATGAVTLDHTSNDVDNLAINAAGQTVDFVDADDIDIDTVAGVTGITAGTVHLHGTSITDTQRTQATNLALTATGAVTLDVATNDVDNLAISAAGQTVEFRDVDDIDIDTVAGVTGITAGTVHLRGTSMTDTQAITATNLALTATGAVTLDHASNDVDNLAISAAGQTVEFRDADDIDIDTVAGITGATAGTLHLRGSSITDTQAITATNLALTATGAVTLDHASNDVDNLAISAAGQTVEFRDVDDINIATIAGITGATAGTLYLRGTSITDSQRILATNLAVTSTGTVTLDHASNDVDNLAISAAGQTVTFTDADDVDIDTVSGVTGISAATLNLNANGAVTDTSASTVTGTTTIAAGAANDITLDVATNDFSTVAMTSGRNVNISDQNAVTLNGSTISGTLDIAAVGVTISGNVTTNGITTIDADRNNAGTGNFTVDATRTLDTNDHDLSVIANDMALNGNLDAGTAELTLEVSDGGTMGLGNAGGNFAISNAELGRMTAADFIFGGATTGNITIDGVNIGASTFNADANGADIIFSGAASIFDSLLASANDGINVNVDLTTDVGDLTLNADNDAAADVIDALNLAAGVDLASADDLFFGNTTNSGTLAGTITITAADDIAIDNELDGAATLTITSTAGDIGITGALGQTTPLTSLTLDGADLSGEVHADAISVAGTSANLTGSVMGGIDQAAASAIGFTGPVGAGPYLMNGFSIFYTPPTTGTIPGGAPGRSTTSELATTIGTSPLFTQIPAFEIGGYFMNSNVSGEATAMRNTPGDLMFQNLSQEKFVPNIFEHDFTLVKLSQSLRSEFLLSEDDHFGF